MTNLPFLLLLWVGDISVEMADEDKVLSTAPPPGQTDNLTTLENLNEESLLLELKVFFFEPSKKTKKTKGVWVGGERRQFYIIINAPSPFLSPLIRSGTSATSCTPTSARLNLFLNNKN